MYLTHLSLTNFRSFTRLDIDVPRCSLVLVGDNAQGKTSLLEAIFYLAEFSSFHAAHDRQLINFMAANENPAVTRIVADFQRDGQAQRLEVRLIQESLGMNSSPRLRKEILVNGVKKNVHESLGCFNAVIFLPQMTRIFEDGPEERRHYLNLLLAQALPGYSKSLSEYNTALTQRNALLKQLQEQGGDASQLDFWDELVTRQGAFLIQARIQLVEQIERIAGRIHQRLTRGQEILRLVYQPSYDPVDKPVKQYQLPMQTAIQRSGISQAEICKGFANRLAAVRREEIARGTTTIGPHRDELRFLGNTIDLGDFGSRGQIRTALLALKLAEVTWLKEKTGQWPVLLLDEILAELDGQRRADLQDFLLECEQALLTTTDINLFLPKFRELGKIWRIESGQVTV